MAGVLKLLEMFVLIYFPSMVANASPVVLNRYFRGRPIDFYRRWIDGRRILGDGKTWEGAIGGLAAGALTAFLLSALTGLEEKVFLTGTIASLGAILGDITESFFKRRMGLERGKPLPLADQLDFYLGATIGVLLCDQCFQPDLAVYLIGLLVVPILHYSTNYLAFKIGLKDVPW